MLPFRYSHREAPRQAVKPDAANLLLCRWRLKRSRLMARKSIQRLYLIGWAESLPRQGLSGEELSVAWESVEYMWPSVRPLVPVS